jgi:hypothetical protein
LNIPERFRAGLSKIRELNESSVEQIKLALEKPVSGFSSDEDVKLPNRPSDIPVTALESSRETDKADLRQIAEAVAGLYSAKAARDVDVEAFADQVCDAMETLDSKELRLPHAERNEFRKKLLMLLSSEAFAIVSKAFDLATEDERTFCHARILTDVRPVFGSRIEEGPKGAVVVHLLKIDYHQGSSAHHHFYMALDADDLLELRRVIDRAEAKAMNLRSVLGGLRVFGVPKEHK